LSGDHDSASTAPTLTSEQPLSEADIAALEGSALHERWQARGITVVSVADGSGTLGRHQSMAAASVEDAMDAVRGAPKERLDLGRLIGRGGMGVVHEAQQRSLRRAVAVKEPKAEKPDLHVVSALIREAWVTGLLDHPNIIPVHILAQEEGRPRIVMKRVDGVEWAQKLASETRLANGNLGASRLEEHLRILIEVCHAIDFAHARGIVHLDLKPTNVMVGDYGEVYVLDWGVAAGFGPLRLSWMPDVTTISHVVGTPGYLSPEQAEGDGEAFGPATDVYLLGAILHEIVTGEKPHPGPMVISLMSSHAARPKEYGPHVPAELARLLNRAMAAEPSDRFPSVRSFLGALEDYLRHRRSDALTRDALHKLSQLDALREHPDASTDTAAVITECRFGLQQALRIWPQNPEAHEGLVHLSTAVVEQALEDRDGEAAVEALDEHPEPTADLKSRVDALEAELLAQEREASALREHGRQHDHSLFRQQRVLLTAVCGVAWVLWNGGIGLAKSNGWIEVDGTFLLLNVTASGLGFLGINQFVRTAMRATAIHRRGMGIIWSCLFGTAVLWASTYALGMPTDHAAVFAMFLYLGAAGALAVSIDWKVTFVIVACLPMSIGALLQPEHVWVWMAVIGPWGAVALMWVWRAPDPRDTEVTP